jgi:hypothetical protein
LNNPSGPAERIKTWVEILQGVVTVAALLCGGYWFFIQRNLSEQIKLEHTVTQRPVADKADHTLLTVDVRLTNVGKVRVNNLSQGNLEVMQLNPTGNPTPLVNIPLSNPTLEPGESDQALFRTISINNAVKTIQLRSTYPVPNSKLSWEFVSAADIGPGADAKQTSSQITSVALQPASALPPPAH